MTRGDSAANRPNVVFILADDLGWCDLGIEVSRFYESPHIDRLARGGMRFTQGYANCQVCSPSRASILTGKYPPRHGVTDWIGAPAGAAWREWGRHRRLLPAEYKWSLRADEITFAEVFRRAGYRTFFAGKWHLGDTGADPEDFGFEVNKGGWKVGSPMGGYFAPWDNPKLEPGPGGESLPLRHGAIHRRPPRSAVSGLPVVLLGARADPDQPGALGAVSRQGRRSWSTAATVPVRRQSAGAAGGGLPGLCWDDRGGRPGTRRPGALRAGENTIVCFTSDNGGAATGDAYSASMLPLRGGKGHQWEGGIREPLYVRYPGAVEPGTTCDVPVSGIDFYPTLLDLAGLEIPAEQVIDGRSMVPLLRRRHDPAISERDLFWHYPHYGNQGGDSTSMIRRGPWKLIHYHEDGHNELYNLETDPGERRDVRNDQRNTADDLWLRLQRWLDETGAEVSGARSAVRCRQRAGAPASGRARTDGRAGDAQRRLPRPRLAAQRRVVGQPGNRRLAYDVGAWAPSPSTVSCRS